MALRLMAKKNIWMSEHKQLIVFLREPKLGLVKTRLAKSIGKKSALEAYKSVLELTFAACDQIDFDKDLCFSDDAQIKRKAYSSSVQIEGNLGERMENAFKVFSDEGKKYIVLIGSDCPDINASILEEAFKALKNHELVIGPSEDGGYYLIGMCKPQPDLFSGISWSTSSVFKETILKARGLNLRVCVLKELYDLDGVADYTRFKDEFKD